MQLIISLLLLRSEIIFNGHIDSTKIAFSEEEEANRKKNTIQKWILVNVVVVAANDVDWGPVVEW